MTEETQISTPVESAEVTTSSEEVTQDVTTSEDEVTTETQTAETETGAETAESEPEEKLYAGKYKNPEELEKGYLEAQKALTQAQQSKAKYDELIKKQEQQEALNLQKAKDNGFNSVNEQKIKQQSQLAEFDEFYKAIPYVNQDDQPQVREFLNEYYRTGNVNYLNEAKRYYPADFLENVAVAKVEYENQLKTQFENEAKERAAKAEQELAETLKTEYGDFIENTVKANKGFEDALKMFCNAGFIQSSEDMEVFKGIVENITNGIKEQAIKEYEAQKVIEETKKKAAIDTNGQPAGIETDSGIPSADELRAHPELYRKAVQKYGMAKVDEVIMKG